MSPIVNDKPGQKPPVKPTEPLKPVGPGPRPSVLEGLLAPHFKLKEARADLDRLKGAFGDSIPEGALRAWVTAWFRDADGFWMAIGRQWERGDV